MAVKANHHFIPQFYLRGFADGVGRKAKVFTFDSETKTAFKTLVRNVGSRRHFFRVDVNGIDPNYVENEMAKVEGEMSAHLSDVIEAGEFPTPEHFNSVMNLIAQVAVRNPRLRDTISNFHKDIVQKMTELSLVSEEVWESQAKQMRDDGVPLREDISYQDVRDFIDSKEYEIVIDQTYLIGLELEMTEPVLKALGERNWCFVRAPEGHQFICSDEPVVLTWVDDRDTGLFSPGHGVGGTLVTFPLSSNLALMGVFEEISDRQMASSDQMCAINTRTAKYSTKQIYARDGSFQVHIKGQRNVLGEDLPGLLKAASQKPV